MCAVSYFNLILIVPRCTALPGELDTPAGRRTQDLTDTLIAELAEDRCTLWDNYGVDANVKVHIHICMRIAFS